MRILLLDLEVSPNVAHVWGLFNQTVSLDQLQESSYVMCWAAKWYGEKEIISRSLHKNSKKKMLSDLHTLLNDADAVITYNGTSFDIPVANKEFLLNKMGPPSPYRQIDLIKTARDVFRFPSNKLNYIVRALGIGQKTKHKGHSLWVECMAGIDSSWDKMIAYNKNDVRLLEKLYVKMLPWVKNHPNVGLYLDHNNPVCPNCGSDELQRRGYAATAVQKYARMQCMKCGKWSRGTVKVKGPTKIVGM